MLYSPKSLLVVTLTLPLLLPAALRAEDWPQWRGLNRDGVCGETGLLEKFPAEGLKVRWRAPVGWGFGSPVVAQGRVFLHDSDLSDYPGKERIHCWDEATGKVNWTHIYEAAYEDWAFEPTQEIGPVATPIVQNGKIYCLGRLNNLFCMDVRNGDVLWKRDLVKDYDVAFSPGMPSPLIESDLLILFVGVKAGPSILALNKVTGQEVWRSLDERLTFSSPIVMTSGGKKQLIVWTQESVTSLDPATGTSYWRQRLLTGSDYAVSTPVVHKDRLLIGGLMLQMDSDKPGAKVLWPKSTAPARRIYSHTSTALFRGDHLFSAKSSGELVCVDARIGEQVWETDKVTDLRNGASIHLTPNGDSVLLYTNKGELIRAQLSADGYQEISRASVIEPTMPFGGRKVVWAPPAYANRHIFARSGKELVCASLAAPDENQAQSATPAEQYKALLKEFNEAAHGLWKATTDDEKKTAAANGVRVTPRILELVEKNPQDPIALEALVQVIVQEVWMENNTLHPGFGKESPEVKAIALLLRDHIRSDQLVDACKRVHQGFRRECETFLRTVLEKSPHHEVRALACLWLAQFLEYRSLRLDLLKYQPEMAGRYEGLFGKDYLEALQRQDRAQVVKEIEALLKQAIEKYGDVKVPFGGTIRETAELELYEIRNLSVGMPALEIEGEDQDGKKFQLSDSRGKVVLLYFWSEF